MYVMKIHIVQKGDTLYEIAKAYHVPLEELIEMNRHLSDPNMLMPGMKIHIPTSPEAVRPPQTKKEKQAKKEEKKLETKIEKTEQEPIERRPRQEVEMDDHRPHRQAPMQQEGQMRPMMMPQPMPMQQHQQHPQQMPSQGQPMQPAVYCCCCQQLHQMQNIHPFKQSVQNEYHHSSRPKTQQPTQEELQQRHHLPHHQDTHKQHQSQQQEHHQMREKVTSPIRINESYFTDNATFY